MKVFILLEKFGGIGQPNQFWHLPGSRRDVRTGIFYFSKVLKFAFIVQEPGGKMPIHKSSCRCRVCRHIGMCIKLGEIFFKFKLIKGEHVGLVPVVSGTVITIPEHLGHGNLGEFLTIPKYAEFGLSHKDFLSAENTGFPAFTCDPEIIKNFRYILLFSGGFRYAQCTRNFKKSFFGSSPLIYAKSDDQSNHLKPCASEEKNYSGNSALLYVIKTNQTQ